VEMMILLAIKSRSRLYSSAKIRPAKAVGTPDIKTIAKRGEPDNPKNKVVARPTSRGVIKTLRKAGTKASFKLFHP